MKISKVLITGGAGFIGSQLVKYLEKEYPRIEVHILDIFNNKELLANGNDKFLGSYRNLLNTKSQIHIQDIRNVDYNFYSTHAFDVIFHLAAISDTRAENENELLSCNLGPFKILLDYAKNNACRIVYASSAAVYGAKSANLLLEEMTSPDNVYGFSKFSMDSLKARFTETMRGCIGLRFFNVYGPGEEMKGATMSVARKLYDAMSNGIEPTLFEGSDEIKRDFVYVQDVVKAMVQSMFSDYSGVINIGSGVARSFQEVADIIKELTAFKGKIKYVPNPYASGYQHHTCASLVESNRAIGYKPEYSLEKGLITYKGIIEHEL
jgi:ADP-L-glycero-D-manno-heptose 6-epimerase